MKGADSRTRVGLEVLHLHICSDQLLQRLQRPQTAKVDILNFSLSKSVFGY